MLKEFRGHSTFVTTCSYHILDKLLVVTASGDGTVRIFDGVTSSQVVILRPPPVPTSTPVSSLVVDRDEIAPSVHTVLHLHTPSNTLIVVPRGPRAYLVNYQGAVLRTFQDNDKAFVAAAVSSTNQWLYTVQEDGVCCVFDVSNGSLTKSIRDFGIETTRMPGKDMAAEISSMSYHPTKSILAAYSNDKGQKKGQLVLWK
jgi:WD40 repeat-containing protein SMU1